MSRSIHTTRRDAWEARHARFPDEELRARTFAALKQQLNTKRRIKLQVKQKRRLEQSPVSAAPIDAIPIILTNHSEHVHYAVSADDLLAVLRALPVGVADGTAGIELCLGREMQREYEKEGELTLESDPLTGRKGCQIMPGVFSGAVLGVYEPARSFVTLFAYVYDETIAHRSIVDSYVRLQVLSTFVHEIAHHFDFANRIARGRWRGDDEDKVEIYAERMQHSWLSQCVVPYLQTRYPHELTVLSEWLQQHVGADVPLGLLAGDPRATARNGRIYIPAFFSTSRAFESLVSDVLEEQTASQVKLNFARQLHYAEEYALPLRITAGVLADNARNLDAMTLAADIRVHQGEYELALELTQQVLARDRDYSDAIEVMADIYEATAQWRPLLKAAHRLLQLFTAHEHLHYVGALRRRSTAWLGLGDYDQVAADIAELKQFRSRYAQRVAQRLQVKLATEMKP